MQLNWMKATGLAVCLAMTSGVIVSPVMAQNAAQPRPAAFSYNFKDADIAQVAEEILGNGLGVNYRIDPGVTGKMSFRIDQRLTKPQLLAAFEGALNAYDMAIVREGETLVVRPIANASVGAAINDGSSRLSRVGYQVRAVPIQYAAASEVAKVLESLSREKLVLFSSDKLSLILLGGTADEIESAMSSIRLFDQSTLSEARIRFFSLRNASATTVAGDLEKMLKASGTGSVTIAPMKRLNGIFAFSRSKEVLDELSGWVTRLDVPSTDQALSFLVYRPRGVSAEALARTLNQLLGLSSVASRETSTSRETPAGESATTATASEATNTNTDSSIRIVADKETNTVIVSAPEAERVRIQSVLNEVDREPAQVTIEASIVEVTLNNEFSFGVDWQTINGALSISNYTTDSTSLAPQAPGFSVNYLRSDIKAALNALSSKSKVRIVSAPKMTARENATASLQIGDQVPIVKQNSQSTNGGNAPIVSTIDYRDTGVTLKVTPRVLNDNRVAMDVTQEVSSVARTQTSGIDSPTIKQRKLESSLIIPEGTVVALGGLISSSESDSEGGAPLLKDIPGLGNLFKQRARNKDRTELIVLIQVTILRDPSAFNRQWEDFGADIRDLAGRRLAPVQ
ncbi:type II secretion system secretin GspD [Asticcacaulis sp. W401b]|uniref:type II secretion system secretin GspD n=1 Tax=Asticcacaulis sp. W401b TaxID=3388666 RepID=UPI0039707C0D